MEFPAIGGKRGEIMADQRKGKSSRAASLQSNKIVIDDLVTKQKLLEIGTVKGENMKETVSRLVDAEFKKAVKKWE
jgi:hypothetical protein